MRSVEHQDAQPQPVRQPESQGLTRRQRVGAALLATTLALIPGYASAERTSPKQEIFLPDTLPNHFETGI
jgi:hypothetical protein